MKLTVRCRSGLRIDFEGDLDELERFDGFLAELARLERDRLAPAATVPAEVTQTIVVAEPSPDPDPSPPCAPGPAAEPAATHRPEPVPEPSASASAGGRDGNPTDEQRVLAALNELGEATVSQIRDRSGLTGKSSKAIRMTLVRLRDKNLVAHNGEPTIRGRWLAATTDTDQADEQLAAGIDALSRAALTPAPDPEPETDPPVVRREQSPLEGRVIGAGARAQMDAQRDARHDQHRDKIRELVAEHGPCSYSWVADQLVKNRRDTAALMRDMTAAGELAETDEGGYYDIPDREALAA